MKTDSATAQLTSLKSGSRPPMGLVACPEGHPSCHYHQLLSQSVSILLRSRKLKQMDSYLVFYYHTFPDQHSQSLQTTKHTLSSSVRQERSTLCSAQSRLATTPVCRCQCLSILLQYNPCKHTPDTVCTHEWRDPAAAAAAPCFLHPSSLSQHSRESIRGKQGVEM